MKLSPLLWNLIIWPTGPEITLELDNMVNGSEIPLELDNMANGPRSSSRT